MYNLQRAILPLSFVLLAAGAAVSAAESLSPAPTGDASILPVMSGPICPQFLRKYCVVEGKFRAQWAFTNPCLAKKAGWKIVSDVFCSRVHSPY